MTLWEPSSQGSPHLQTQFNDGSRFTLSWPYLIFPFHVLPSAVHPTGFTFCFFPDFLAIFIMLSSNKINNIRKTRVLAISPGIINCTQIGQSSWGNKLRKSDKLFITSLPWNVSCISQQQNRRSKNRWKNKFTVKCFLHLMANLLNQDRFGWKGKLNSDPVRAYLTRVT